MKYIAVLVVVGVVGFGASVATPNTAQTPTTTWPTTQVTIPYPEPGPIPTPKPKSSKRPPACPVGKIFVGRCGVQGSG